MQSTTFNAVVAHTTSSLPVIPGAAAAASAPQQVVEQSTLEAILATPDDGITTFQHRLYDVAFNSAERLHEAVESQRINMAVLIASEYGDTCPTYKQYMSDHAALRTLAAYKGFVDAQWLRKPYNAAIKSLYGALPVAMTEAAILKRQQRDAKNASKTAEPEAVGAVKGDTSARNPSGAEQLEQLIAKVGVFAAMEAIAKILETERKSATDAKAIKAIAAHYKAA